MLHLFLKPVFPTRTFPSSTKLEKYVCLLFFIFILLLSFAFFYFYLFSNFIGDSIWPINYTLLKTNKLSNRSVSFSTLKLNIHAKDTPFFIFLFLFLFLAIPDWPIWFSIIHAKRTNLSCNFQYFFHTMCQQDRFHAQYWYQNFFFLFSFPEFMAKKRMEKNYRWKPFFLFYLFSIIHHWFPAPAK